MYKFNWVILALNSSLLCRKFDRISPIIDTRHANLLTHTSTEYYFDGISSGIRTDLIHRETEDEAGNENSHNNEDSFNIGDWTNIPVAHCTHRNNRPIERCDVSSQRRTCFRSRVKILSILRKPCDLHPNILFIDSERVPTTSNEMCW